MEVHINQLPLKRNYVVLENEFHNELAERLLQVGGSIDGAGRLIGIADTTMGRIVKKESRRRIRLDSLLKILHLLNIPLEKAEGNIIWMGSNQSKGIENPKLPFNFKSRAAARFLAAICNDGCITVGYRKGRRFSYGRLMYNNNEKSLRESVVKDAKSVFGPDISKEFYKRNEFFLVFPSIARDTLEVITEFKGQKSVNNPPVPPFILEDTELILGWIEQTIADEGHINYIPNKYRREVVWRRSFDLSLPHYKLIEDEKKMLEKVCLRYEAWNIGTYKTKKRINKVRIQMRIAKRENVVKLRNLIKIPCKIKDKIFTEMVNNFMRYKEPLEIKDKIVNICKEKGYITAQDLAKSMNYKNISNSYKWIKHYLRIGLLICIQKSYYTVGYNGPIPAKYALVEP